MVKHPEIEEGQIYSKIQPDLKRESGGKEGLQGISGDEKGADPMQFSGTEFCGSCLEMPEEQRKTMILKIQQVAERVLRAHGVIRRIEDLLKGEWFLKLGKPGFEKKFVIARSGEEIFVGLYSYSDDTPIPDPNLVLLSQNGFWYPQRIEEQFDETVCSFFTGAYGDYEYLNVIPENLEKFQVFQRDFARVLMEQGWEGPEVEVIEKIMPKN